MNFKTFEDLSNHYKNKIVEKESYLQDMKSYFSDYRDVIERKNLIKLKFDDFDIEITFKKLTNKKYIRILNIKHC